MPCDTNRTPCRTKCINRQFAGYDAATAEQWNVSLGNDSQSTVVVNQVTRGATPWRSQTMNFTATGASEVMSFLAVGTPSGYSPSLLLDSVSMTSAVP